MSKAKNLKSSEGTGSKDVQRETTANIVYSLEKNPLKIPVVLDHLFNVVDYKTLKVCRLVSPSWKTVCDPIFVQRSVFVFENKTRNSKTMRKSPVEMQQLFGSIKGDVKFTAFKFQIDFLTGPVEKMYFNPNKSDMTHLEIISGGYGRQTEDWSNIDKWIHPHLKKLIVSAPLDRRAFDVSVEKLAGISHISLDECKLKGISGEIKMSPKELILKHIYLQNPLEHIVIADFVDFRHLQVLHLDFSDCKDQTPYLNFSNCATIKTLKLINTKINLDGLISPRILELTNNLYYVNGKKRSYNDSPCFINNYILEGTHLDKMSLWCREKNVIFDFGHPISVDKLMIFNTMMKTATNGGEIKIKDMHISVDERFDDDEDIVKCGIDISYLPSSLENLEIYNLSPYLSTFTSSGDVCFPKLRQLCLQGCQGEYGNGRSGFALFDKCPLLADVTLFNYNGAIFSNNDEDAFPALKRLQLQDVAELTLNNTLHPKVINLDVLVIPSLIYPEIFPFEVFAKFRAKLGVFFNAREPISEKTVTMLIRMKQSMHLENIAFGRVIWETDESFKESLLFSFGETEGEYYLLEGDAGKAISCDEFMYMIPNQDGDDW